MTPLLHVVLVHPEIPPNTGNVGRLCAATGTRLHLVRPLGFSLDDRYLRRAGLDYWHLVDLHVHDSLESALADSGAGPVLYFSARADRPYDQAPYRPGARLVFGPETRGLDPDLLGSHPESCFQIPIWGGVRSINLSSAVAVATYEAYRQLGAWDPRAPASSRGAPDRSAAGPGRR